MCEDPVASGAAKEIDPVDGCQTLPEEVEQAVEGRRACAAPAARAGGTLHCLLHISRQVLVAVEVGFERRRRLGSAAVPLDRHQSTSFPRWRGRARLERQARAPSGARSIHRSDRHTGGRSPLSSPAERVTVPADKGCGWPNSWASDGGALTVACLNGTWVISRSGNFEPRPVMTTAGSAGQSDFSPDGRWLAYSTFQSQQVYVQPFPALDRQQQVSTVNGTAPAWRGDGRELERPQEAREHRLLGDDGHDPERAPAAKRTRAPIQPKDAAQQPGPRPGRGARGRRRPVQPLLARGGENVTVQVVKTGVTLRLATADRFREAAKGRLRHAKRPHGRR